MHVKKSRRGDAAGKRMSESRTTELAARQETPDRARHNGPSHNRGSTVNRTPPVLAGAAVASALFLAIARAMAAGNAAAVPAEMKAPLPANLISSGEVTKVDRSGGKVTIKHGPLRNLDMPAMTMAFRVSDQAMLDQVKAGERIEFVAENVNGTLTVVRLQAVK
jgi:Cu/Ag efflux protein CusF